MDCLTGTNRHKQAQVNPCESTNRHTPLYKGVRLCLCVKKWLLSHAPVKLTKRLKPGYHLAAEKREFETYLRSQGWTRKEALAAVAKKYSPTSDEEIRKGVR
jgi:hypothetical protein